MVQIVHHWMSGLMNAEAIVQRFLLWFKVSCLVWGIPGPQIIWDVWACLWHVELMDNKCHTPLHSFLHATCLVARWEHSSHWIMCSTHCCPCMASLAAGHYWMLCNTNCCSFWQFAGVTNTTHWWCLVASLGHDMAFHSDPGRLRTVVIYV